MCACVCTVAGWNMTPRAVANDESSSNITARVVVGLVMVGYWGRCCNSKVRMLPCTSEEQSKSSMCPKCDTVCLLLLC
jgi:hypothetical protein